MGNGRWSSLLLHLQYGSDHNAAWNVVITNMWWDWKDPTWCRFGSISTEQSYGDDGNDGGDGGGGDCAVAADYQVLTRLKVQVRQ